VEEWQEMGRHCDSPTAFAVMGAHRGFPTAEFFEKNRDRIAAELADNPAWLEIGKEQGWPIQRYFGFTEEEILELQRHDERKYLSEIERLRAYL
jgi:hypothetical protein